MKATMREPFIFRFFSALDARSRIALAVFLAVTLIAIPALHLMLPPESAFHVSTYAITLLGKIMCYAIVAVAMDLIWGFGGILSLGHGIFFALGGYAMGMYLMRQIGRDGNYQSDLPDFMVFLDWKQLPWYWRGSDSFWWAALLVVLLPALVAFIFGFFAFRSRIKGVYFSILTQALTYGAALLFYRNSLLMGGNNGFTDYKFLLGSDLRTAATQRWLYIATAVTLLMVYLGCRALSQTKFGLVQRAIRDGENRVLFSGYASAHFKLFIFVLSSIIAGVGGALYVPQVGGMNPSVMTPEKSLEAVVWVAVGGRGTLLGPILGAIAINALKTWATVKYPDYWLIILGGLFILVVLFLPGGLVSLPARAKAQWKKYTAKKAEVVTDAPVPAEKS